MKYCGTINVSFLYNLTPHTIPRVGKGCEAKPAFSSMEERLLRKCRVDNLPEFYSNLIDISTPIARFSCIWTGIASA